MLCTRTFTIFGSDSNTKLVADGIVQKMFKPIQLLLENMFVCPLWLLRLPNIRLSNLINGDVAMITKQTSNCFELEWIFSITLFDVENLFHVCLINEHWGQKCFLPTKLFLAKSCWISPSDWTPWTWCGFLLLSCPSSPQFWFWTSCSGNLQEDRMVLWWILSNQSPWFG